MFNIELDITGESTHSEITQFAKEHGCSATLIKSGLHRIGKYGRNPLYLFQSEKFDYLDELASQVLGVNTDIEFIKTAIYEN